MLMLMIRSISRSNSFQILIRVHVFLEHPEAEFSLKRLRLSRVGTRISEDRPESVKELAPVLSIKGGS